MTSEQPPSSSRQPRPGVAARRSALGIDGGGDPPPLKRESLRDSLARIPDLTPDETPPEIAPPPADAEPAAPATDPAPAKDRAREKDAAPAEPAAKSTAKEAAPAAPPAADPADASSQQAEEHIVAFTAPASAPPAADAARAAAPAAKDGDPAPGTLRTGARPKPPMWRRVAFGVALVGLIAAIPVLGAAGYHLISESKDGTYSGTTLTPADPGFEAQVEPTPTAVAIQYDDDNMPNAVTFLSLSGPDGGGSVIFVPLDTEVQEPAYGVDTLRKSYEVVSDRPALARERLASQVGRLLNVGVDEVIDLGNEGWNQLVAPVAPLTISNPDALDLGFGQVIPTGATTLNADQVGRYLAATIDGESDLNRLNRHEVVWSAWLEQVAASGQSDSVPGEATAGIGKFAQALAPGPVTYDTLPVHVVDDLLNPLKVVFRIDKPAVNELVTETVPAPTAAVPGSRFTVRLLNGVSADSIPSEQVRQIVSRGGAVTILGNGPSFGNDETTVVYANPADKGLANLIAKSMGATGTVRLDREAPDTVDLTIVLGKDILGEATGTGSAGDTTPQTTAAGGD